MEYQGQTSAFSTTLYPNHTNKMCFLIGASSKMLKFSSTVDAYTFLF